MALSGLLVADALSVTRAFGTPQWGIYGQDGSPIVESDAVNAVQYARDYQISDYPQEQGAFQSYNKVQVPFQAKLSFIIAATRQGFLNSIERAVASLEFVTVVTPEVRYPSANLIHYDYRRTASHGKTLIIVEVWVEEVRVVANTAQATASNPTGQATGSTNGADSTQSGNVQAVAVAGSATGAGAGNVADGDPVFASGIPDSESGKVTILGITSTSLDESGNPIPGTTNTWSALTPEQQQTIADYGTGMPTEGVTTVIVPVPPPGGSTPNATVTFTPQPVPPT